MHTPQNDVIIWLDPNDEQATFPEAQVAMREPNGLLAAGGKLTPKWLLNAYRKGVFPWYNLGQPILWWSPDPRAVLFPDDLKVSRSLKKTMRNADYHVSLDQAFRAVIDSCAQVRGGRHGTWIQPEITQAYCTLHELGIAHSVETWHEDKLVGGLYGVSLGKIFFGESMFFRERDASKVAFVYLVHQLKQWQYALIDCQVGNPHLKTLGAIDIPREAFVRILNEHCNIDQATQKWQLLVNNPYLR